MKTDLDKISISIYMDLYMDAYLIFFSITTICFIKNFSYTGTSWTKFLLLI